jgi:isopentenyldiphosphate isomerase
VKTGSELVDWVDERDEVIEVVTRARMRSEHLRHRAVFIAVRSSQGELLVHRRSDDKDLWPGRWDIAVGGVVGSGEGYDEAALRELAEEVGLQSVDLVPVATGVYTDDDVNLVARIYTVIHDGPYAFDDGEVVEASLIDLSEVLAWASRVDVVPDSWALVRPMLEM